MPENELIFLDPEPFEIRDLEKRQISGRVVPFNEVITFRGRKESFAHGAFTGIVPASVKLLRDHDRSKPVGRMLFLEQRADGAHAIFQVSKTAAGDEALTLAADGVLDGLSPGFLAGDQTSEGVHTRISAMPEVSLVPFSAYQGSKVLSVRESEAPVADTNTETPVEETAPEFTMEDLTSLQTRQDEMMAAIQRLQTTVDTPAPSANVSIKPLAWFKSQVELRLRGNDQPYLKLQEAFEGLQTRALADVVGGETQAGDNDPADDLSGLVLEQFVGAQLVQVLDARRPLFRSFGSFPAIRSGYARIPIVTQHTLVAARGAQKTEVPSRAPIVTTQPFEAQWAAGAVDVALELIKTAEIGVLQFIWEDLLGQYAKYVEAQAVALMESDLAGVQYEGAVLSTDTYTAFVTDVVTQAMKVRQATDLPATRLAVTEAQWIALVALMDAAGHRVFAAGDRSDSTASFTAESFTLPGGIEVFYVPNITRAYLYNEVAVRAVDYGPERYDALNVAQMGQDIGLLGRYMIVPRIPAGVVIFDAEPV